MNACRLLEHLCLKVSALQKTKYLHVHVCTRSTKILLFTILLPRMDSPAHYFEFIQKTFEGKMIVDVKVCTNVHCMWYIASFPAPPNFHA